MKSSYTKEQTRLYNAFYKEVILKGKRSTITPLININYRHSELETLPLNGTETICSTFGCSTILTNREKLFSNKCLSCQQKKGQLDPTIHLKFK
jgi:hypothetical protein